MMSSVQAKGYWNKKGSNEPYIAVGLFQISSDRIATTLRSGEFVMYSVQPVPLGIGVELFQKLIYSDNKV